MGKTIKQLNQELSFEFADLDIKGTNIESYYDKRFQVFLLDNSELSPTERVEVYLSGQLNGKTEITIQKVLSEKTFIQDQIIRTEAYLKEPIRPTLREKLLIWYDFLMIKGKTIKAPKKVTLPFKSLRRVYSFILAEAYHKGHTEIKDMTKKDFMTYIVNRLGITDISPATIYQTVNSHYKNEKNFIHYTPQMKQAYPDDYNYAMKIYKDYFPEKKPSKSE